MTRRTVGVTVPYSLLDTVVAVEVVLLGSRSTVDAGDPCHVPSARADMSQPWIQDS